MKNKQSKITDGHYLALSDAVGAAPTVSLYGKLIKNVMIDPKAAGILHPTNPGGTLLLAQVVGYSDQGQCQRVAPPVMLPLPEPDGPADGCGWDPKQYVVWKNLPKNWTTLQLHTQPRTLGDVLFAGPSLKLRTDVLRAAVETRLGVRDTVNKTVKDWATMTADPLGTDVLQVLWAVHASGPFADAAQDLVTKINSAFGTHLLATDINPPGSIKTVDNLVSAVT